MKKDTLMRVPKSLLCKLKKQKIIERESYASVVERLLLKKLKKGK